VLVPGPTPSMYAIETYTTTAGNGAKPSRAGRLAVGDLVAIVRLGRLVVKVVDRVALRIAEQSHLDVVAPIGVQCAVRVVVLVLAVSAEGGG
jgi:hypothetical protein